MQVLKFKHIDKIVDAINTNKACVVETDTVMGVLAKDPKIIYELKKRDQAKKLILFIPSRKQVTGLSSEHNALINQFWPGQLTIIFKGVGYRLPNHPKLIKIIEKTGPLYSSSANLSGNEPVKN
jgi:L-threonylcarbamoyladenylate synthase